MIERLVAIDLETTGPHPSRDDIVEFGAARIENGRITDRFSELADPGRPLPLRITKLTGIRPEDVRGKPSPQTVAGRFLQFIGDDPVTAHDARSDLGLLERLSGARLPSPVFDALRLSRMLWPTVRSHDLETLMQILEIGGEEAHRAGDDAHALARLWLRMMARLESMPLAVVAEIALLLEPTGHPLHEIFRTAGQRATDQVFDHKKVSAEDLLQDFGAIIQRREKHEAVHPPKSLDVGAVCEWFLPGHLLEQKLPAYEYRAEQVRMVKEVCEAYNDGLLLMVEAGTGTGKSMAYLVPSILWAVSNDDRVVISTNTKNLQTQLFQKDLPFLEEALDLPFRKALIKGRSNYLCVRKFLHAVRHADQELSAEERLQIPPLMSWLEETETGDIAENTGFMADFSPELWAKLSTQQDECVGARCPQFRKCFVRRARALSLGAHIVVANHAVVFAEMGLQDSVVLPPYRHCIFDEAHNLESVATEYLAVRVSPFRVYRVLNRLHRGRRDGSGTGLFTNIRFQMSRAKRHIDKPFYRDIENRIHDAVAAMPRLADRGDEFFNAVALLFEETNAQNDKVRYGPGAGMPDRWGPVTAGSQALSDALERFAEKIEMLQKALALLVDKAPEAAALSPDLEFQARSLREVRGDLDFLMRAADEESVYWVQRTMRRAPVYEVCAAPLDITRLMTEHVYEAKRAVVLSSATLSVSSRPGGTASTGSDASDFRFMTERLGLRECTHRLRMADVGSPFDFDRQVLFAVPTFLPDPRDGGRFSQGVAELASRILARTRGRGLLLFTSYSMLNEAHPIVREALEPEGILVLAQGVDGSRSKITETFQKDVSSVLLGTQSFWEGVDVAGESLSCLLLAKLPFQVFTEPIIKARCELIESRGEDAFVEYSVPSAVIRLKQGFGRLIRRRSDRGVVVLTDKRVMTRGYGRRFVRSLPTRPRTYSREADLLAAVGAFLDDDPS